MDSQIPHVKKARHAKRKPKKQSRFLTLLIVSGAYLAVVLMTFGIENSELLEVFPGGHQAHRLLENYGSLYRFQMQLVPRPVESHYVSLVDLGTRQGPCETREMIAKIFPALLAARPAMIVSDVAFGRKFCGDKRQETLDLVQAIEDGAAIVPTVIGIGSESLAEIRDNRAEHLLAKGFAEDDLLDVESVQIRTADLLSFGHIRMNTDLRKIPIEWYAREGEDGPLKFEDSLSYAAAKLYRRNFPDRGMRLLRLKSARGGIPGVFNKGAPRFQTVVGLQAQMIDVQSGEVIASVPGRGQVQQSGTLVKDLDSATDAAISEVVKNLQGKDIPATRASSASGLVADIRGNTVVINIGRSAGIRVGDIFSVKRSGRQVKGLTGQVLGGNVTNLGKVTITSVDEGAATGVFSGAGSVKIGDQVTK